MPLQKYINAKHIHIDKNKLHTYNVYTTKNKHIYINMIHTLTFL